MSNGSAHRAHSQSSPPTGFVSSRVQAEWERQQREPAVSATLHRVRGDVIREVIEAIPLVRAYRGYQHLCVHEARRREPELTADLTDRQVWGLLKSSPN